MALKRQLPLDCADSTRQFAPGGGTIGHNFLTVTAEANVRLVVGRSSRFLAASANHAPQGAMRRVTAQPTLHKRQIFKLPTMLRDATERAEVTDKVDRVNVRNKRAKQIRIVTTNESS